jgi:hypothetical protein
MRDGRDHRPHRGRPGLAAQEGHLAEHIPPPQAGHHLLPLPDVDHREAPLKDEQGGAGLTLHAEGLPWRVGTGGHAPPHSREGLGRQAREEGDRCELVVGHGGEDTTLGGLLDRSVRRTARSGDPPL